MPRRRYRTEEEILAAIDRNGVAIRVAEGELDKLHTVLQQYRKTKADAWFIEDVEMRLKHCHRSLANRYGRKLRLKDKLAEFRTPQLVGVDNGDVSIPR